MNYVHTARQNIMVPSNVKISEKKTDDLEDAGRSMFTLKIHRSNESLRSKRTKSTVKNAYTVQGRGIFSFARPSSPAAYLFEFCSEFFKIRHDQFIQHKKLQYRTIKLIYPKKYITYEY